MAWLANPFAYIAMNTVIPLIPQVAANFQFSKAGAGFFCSIWMFARTASFFALWKWTAWHYRFRWIIASYILMIVTFAAILIGAQFWLLVAAQIVFGFAVGLIYYSSLFYSMDASDTKGEHGGLHEAAIGAGIFLGPAIGYTALELFPTASNVSATAVSAILTLGIAGLLFLRKH
jgi:predicted MFS family arabinose efflux permease